MHADEVVGVHDGVDETIQGYGQVNVSIVKDIDIQPVEQENRDVMVDVQKGKLSPLFPQDNEDGVPEVPYLGNIKKPQKVGKGRIVTAVSHTGSDSVAVAVRQEQCFNCHVSTQHDLRDVVKEFDWVWIHGGQKFHHLRPNDNKQKVGKSDIECTREIRQEPALQNWKTKRKIRQQFQASFPCHMPPESSKQHRQPRTTYLGVASKLTLRIGPKYKGVPNIFKCFCVRIHGYFSLDYVECKLYAVDNYTKRMFPIC